MVDVLQDRFKFKRDVKMGKDQMQMRLVDEDLDEESLTDEGVRVKDDSELHQLRVGKIKTSYMGACGQVTVFLMGWLLMLGVGMLAVHVAARQDLHRGRIMTVALASGWIAMSNVFAFAFFVVDKLYACNNCSQMSPALAHVMLALGGVAGGWVGVCVTCYKPPPPAGRISAFVFKAMVCSAIGLTCDIVFALRVILPNLHHVLH